MATRPNIAFTSLWDNWLDSITVRVDAKGGSVKGLSARGGCTVDFEWRDGKVTKYKVSSKSPREITVRINGELKKVKSEIIVPSP